MANLLKPQYYSGVREIQKASKIGYWNLLNGRVKSILKVDLWWLAFLYRPTFLLATTYFNFIILKNSIFRNQWEINVLVVCVVSLHQS